MDLQREVRIAPTKNKLNKSLQTTKLKPTLNICYVRPSSSVEFHMCGTLILVHQSNKIRQLIQTSDIMGPKLISFVVNIRG